MKRLILCVAYVYLVVLGSLVFGQGINGSLTGLVTDSSGAAVPNAEVRAKNLATGVATAVLTNNAGSYNVASVPIGTYEISIESQGFKRFVKTGIVLETAQTV